MFSLRKMVAAVSALCITVAAVHSSVQPAETRGSDPSTRSQVAGTNQLTPDQLKVIDAVSWRAEQYERFAKQLLENADDGKSGFVPPEDWKLRPLQQQLIVYASAAEARKAGGADEFLAWFVSALGTVDDFPPSARAAMELEPAFSTIRQAVAPVLRDPGAFDAVAAFARLAFDFKAIKDKSAAALFDQLPVETQRVVKACERWAVRDSGLGSEGLVGFMAEMCGLTKDEAGQIYRKAPSIRDALVEAILRRPPPEHVEIVSRMGRWASEQSLATAGPNDLLRDDIILTIRNHGTSAQRASLERVVRKYKPDAATIPTEQGRSAISSQPKKDPESGPPEAGGAASDPRPIPDKPNGPGTGAGAGGAGSSPPPGSAGGTATGSGPRPSPPHGGGGRSPLSVRGPAVDRPTGGGRLSTPPTERFTRFVNERVNPALKPGPGGGIPFDRMSRTGAGPGGVIAGAKLTDQTGLDVGQSVSLFFIPDQFFAARGRLLLLVGKDRLLDAGSVLAEDLRVAQSFVLDRGEGAPKHNEEDAIILASIDYADPAYKKIISYNMVPTVINPKLESTELGWDLIRVDLLLLLDDFSRFVTSARARSGLSELAGPTYKVMDSPSSIELETDRLVVVPTAGRKALFTMNFFDRIRVGAAEEDYVELPDLAKKFDSLAPTLLTSSAIHARLNGFYKVLSVARWAAARTATPAGLPPMVSEFVVPDRVRFKPTLLGARYDLEPVRPTP